MNEALLFCVTIAATIVSATVVVVLYITWKLWRDPDPFDPKQDGE